MYDLIFIFSDSVLMLKHGDVGHPLHQARHSGQLVALLGGVLVVGLVPKIAPEVPAARRIPLQPVLLDLQTERGVS